MIPELSTESITALVYIMAEMLSSNTMIHTTKRCFYIRDQSMYRRQYSRSLLSRAYNQLRMLISSRTRNTTRRLSFRWDLLFLPKPVAQPMGDFITQNLQPAGAMKRGLTITAVTAVVDLGTNKTIQVQYKLLIGAIYA